MLEIFIVLNEKDAEKEQWKGFAQGSKGERGGRRRDYFFKRNKCLGLPPRKCLFKVLSLTLTSK